MNRRERRAAGKLGRAPAAAPDKTAPLDGRISAVMLFDEGLGHHRAGRLAAAEACYHRLLKIQPDHADALHLLGVVALQTKRAALAVDLISRAVRHNDLDPLYFFNLGKAQHELGERTDAIAAYRRAIGIKPDMVEAYVNLGNALCEQNEFDEAIVVYRRATGLKPDFAESHLILGNALQKQGKFEEAITAYRNAIHIKPDYAEAHGNLGNALREWGDFAAALAAYDEAIRIKADFAEAHSNRGTALREAGRLGEAVEAYGRAIDIKPDFADVFSNLGNALQDQGRLDEAIAAYKRALDLAPQDAEIYSNLLFCLIRSDAVTPKQLFDGHRSWGERYARPLPPPSAYVNDPDPIRRLKIGYVSPDFRLHSVAYFLEPLIKEHDRQMVEIFCYAEVKRPDDVTARLHARADHWRSTFGQSDDTLAQCVRADGIDILVDLAGHTAKNRLRLFARKPAPIQVTWLGYPDTTGLAAIDYRLVDAITDPSGEADAFASEALVRLPDGFLCYDNPANLPELADPPCAATGHPTFGSFNNPTKISRRTLDAWANLLAALPDARLLLKGKPFGDATTRASFQKSLAERGVEPERVDLVAWLPTPDAHLGLYNCIDVALDPFPYNGTTTTCEALSMGVPVVTLRGDRHAARVGASLLTQVGLTNLIATSIEDYVGIAQALADDPQRLADLRQSLRPRLAASPLCDSRTFARKIEAAYRTMWQRWCAR